MSDPKIKLLIKEHWEGFKTNSLSELMNYIDQYSFIIQGAKARDVKIWHNTKETSDLKLWLENRVLYMNGFINSF